MAKTGKILPTRGKKQHTPGGPRDAMVRVLFTKSEKKNVKAVAKAAGTSASGWVRKATLRQLRGDA